MPYVVPRGPRTGVQSEAEIRNHRVLAGAVSLNSGGREIFHSEVSVERFNHHDHLPKLLHLLVLPGSDGISRLWTTNYGSLCSNCDETAETSQRSSYQSKHSAKIAARIPEN
eukprot:290711_1